MGFNDINGADAATIVNTRCRATNGNLMDRCASEPIERTKWCNTRDMRGMQAFL